MKRSPFALCVAALLSCFAGALQAVYAEPVGFQLVSGSAELATPSQNSLIVRQHSQTVRLDWTGFSIDSGETVHFEQPSAAALAVNRVTGDGASLINGELTANGRLFLINPNGILIGAGGRVDAAGFLASTLDLADGQAALGERLDFAAGPAQPALLSHAGAITLAEGGQAVLVAPQLSLTGQISAPSGQVDLAVARGFSIDLTGDGLIRFGGASVLGALDPLADGAGDRLQMAGQIVADGGQIRLTSKAASDIVSGVVNLTGTLRARQVQQQGGVITLSSDLPVKLGGAALLDAKGADWNDSHLEAGSQTGKGGQIEIMAPALSAGGRLEASGADGGQITLTVADQAILAGQLTANGQTGTGGSLRLSAGRVQASSSASWQANGAERGGQLHLVARQSAALSGSWQASSQSGSGGQIHVTAPDLRLLSAKMDASGGSAGGLLRLGGPFQGGKGMAADPDLYQFVTRWGELPHLARADRLFVNDGSQLDVSASDGPGGTAILWSDQQTSFLGQVDARGGAGGQLELSSAGTLRTTGLDRIELGGGRLLLDPKNIIIGTSTETQSWAYEAILGQFTDHDAVDYLGYSVALNKAGDRLAIGAIGDNGAGNATAFSGAVHLFSFTDSAFSGGTLEGTIGNGYTGGKNVDVSSLETPDMFGSSVALDGDGDRLAVGAFRDSGSGNGNTYAGAVRLFSFSDTSFSGGALEATIGQGYTGGKNLDLSDLDNFDYFGASVALDDSATKLAVGAYGDDGANDDAADAGAAWLISFTDGDFSGASLSGRIGVDYSGSGNLSPSGLAAGDQLGRSVALDGDGNRMAVGLPGDDGDDGSSGNAGAAWLISFSDTGFSDPAREAIIGKGYTGGKNISVADLAGGDQLGSAVALDGDGDRLAVGAPTDDGAGDSLADSGLARLYQFGDLDFSSGTLAARFGSGYAAAGDLSLAALDSFDQFGIALALDETGSLLAAGASFDDGLLDDLVNGGAVWLFRGSHASGSRHAQATSFASNGSEATALNALQISDLLSRGTDITLQASNDITLNSAILAAASSGAAGSLTLQAGRSVLLNAGITTDGGDITLIGNDLLANGVVDGDREAGNSVITMAASSALNAGSGAVSVDLRAGTGKSYSSSGAITLSDITGSTIRVTNSGPSSNSGLILLSGKQLTASASGDAIVLAGDDFTNNAGSAALATSHANGRWQVWTGDPDADSAGGLTPDFYQYDAAYGSASVAGGAAENGLFYSRTISLTPSLSNSAASGATKTYDGTTTASLTASDLSLSGTRGTESITLAATSALFADANAGSGKTITLSGLTLSSVSENSLPVYGYQLSQNSAANSSGVITAKALSISGSSAADKAYDGSRTATVTAGSLSGLVGAETLSVSASGLFADADVGSNKAVAVSYSLTDGSGAASNYSLAGETLRASITGSNLSASLARAPALNRLMRVEAAAAAAGGTAAGGAVAGSPGVGLPGVGLPGVGLPGVGFGPAAGIQAAAGSADSGGPQILQAVQRAAPAGKSPTRSENSGTNNSGTPNSGANNSGLANFGQENGPIRVTAIPGRICVEDSRGQSLCTLR